MLIEVCIVKNSKEREKEIEKLSKRVMKGKIENKTTVILTAGLFAKIFSAKRMELLMTISEKQVGTISELARKLHRKFEVIYRDLKLFEEFGFVRLTKIKRSVTPALAGEIRMPIIAQSKHAVESI